VVSPLIRSDKLPFFGKILSKIGSFLHKIKKSMLASTEKLIDGGFGERVFTEKDLARFFGGTPARRYGLVNKALTKGELIRIRRGVYILSEKYRTVKFSRFFVANQTVSGSYISFESALSYHGWIPERVAVVASGIYRGRSRRFETPLGEFQYVFLPFKEFTFFNGVSRQIINGKAFFMANPLRALADYMSDRKLEFTGIDFLLEGLRIEEESLNTLTKNDFKAVQPVFRAKRVQLFLQRLQKEIIVTKRKMNHSIINDRLQKYSPKTVEEEEDALKEILQEIILNALSQANFFEEAIFHGGTCLRVVHRLQRFSEDLDFLLKRVNPDFKWQPYQKAIIEVCRQYGISPEIKDKSKAGTFIQKMFVKDNSIGKLIELSFKHHPYKKISIKLEIDINPPAGSTTEVRFLDFPVDFPIEIQDISSSFASKSHALLCRTYVKGRDWYDFLWYVSFDVKPNFYLLSNAINQQGAWAKQQISVTPTWYLNALETKIKKIDWKIAKKDVAPFLSVIEKKSIALWGTDFFMAKLEKLGLFLLH
jgi:predicted nucleotidyltransferase component of viral defense system/predicted transcriptional regulator of viral defense system